jgi:hypothetical protein
MKTNSTAIKGFKAVDFMREVRDKISMDIKDMNFEEIQKYMEARRLRLSSSMAHPAKAGLHGEI